MKYLKLSVILVLISSKLFAQEKMVYDAQTIKMLNEPFATIGTDNDKNTYFVRYSKEVCYIEKYDQNMKFVASQSVGSIKSLEYPKCKIINGKLYFFGANQSTKDKAAIEAREIKTGSSPSFGPPVKIGDAPLSARQTPVLHYMVVSPDSSKICWLSEKDNAYYKPTALHAIVFDSRLEKVWENDIPMPAGGRDYHSPSLDNDGNLYYLTVASKAQSAYCAANFADYTWKIYKIHGTSASDFTIKLKSDFISTAMFAMDKSGLIIAGVYTGGKGTDVKGVYSLKLDKEGKVINENKNESFSKYITKKIKGTNNECWSIGMTGLSLLDDGGYAWSVSQDFGMSSGAGDFELSEICIKVNADNTFGYISALPIENVNGSDVSQFRHSFAYKNNFYVAYVDAPENAKQTDESKLKAFVTAQYNPDISHNVPTVLVLARFNNDGTYRKMIVGNDNFEVFELRLQDMGFLNNNQIIVPCRADRKKPQPKFLTFKLN